MSSYAARSRRDTSEFRSKAGLAGSRRLGARFGRVFAAGVGASDLVDADHDLRALVTVGEQIEDTIVAKQLIHPPRIGA